MVEHTLANRDKVSEGLVLLPGVKELLEKLQVGAGQGKAAAGGWAGSAPCAGSAPSGAGARPAQAPG